MIRGKIKAPKAENGDKICVFFWLIVFDRAELVVIVVVAVVGEYVWVWACV